MKKQKNPNFIKIVPEISGQSLVNLPATQINHCDDAKLGASLSTTTLPMPTPPVATPRGTQNKFLLFHISFLVGPQYIMARNEFEELSNFSTLHSFYIISLLNG